MFDFLLTSEQKLLQEEAARFVKEKVPKQLILAMDEEKVIYPKEYLMDLGQARLLGLRFAERY
ncbi:MAG: acyl-CoA dehydrogenase family protein, partial [Bacillota bacterium]